MELYGILKRAHAQGAEVTIVSPVDSPQVAKWASLCAANVAIRPYATASVEVRINHGSFYYLQLCLISIPSLQHESDSVPIASDRELFDETVRWRGAIDFQCPVGDDDSLKPNLSIEGLTLKQDDTNGFSHPDASVVRFSKKGMPQSLLSPLNAEPILTQICFMQEHRVAGIEKSMPKLNDDEFRLACRKLCLIDIVPWHSIPRSAWSSHSFKLYV
jgi:hypothetical protein